MSLVSSASELSLAALLRAPATLVQVARAMARTLLNRRAAYRVAELPDYLLTDIGLKRDDVHAALNADWRDDPTLRMAMSARKHRASIRPVRRP
ncbi:DUF1127 domain-containing protein [Aureimonas sp. AU4]|uniref:DUF1127 domain-containing protein n=1 Tax=Aureimonas sp. AU4 TaxID=1638163 RepID=UPI000784957A|nr:DUF1127 domain-containing protein [Aureimonas sp. AU4]